MEKVDADEHNCRVLSSKETEKQVQGTARDRKQGRIVAVVRLLGLMVLAVVELMIWIERIVCTQRSYQMRGNYWNEKNVHERKTCGRQDGYTADLSWAANEKIDTVDSTSDDTEFGQRCHPSWEHGCAWGAATHPTRLRTWPLENSIDLTGRQQNRTEQSNRTEQNLGHLIDGSNAVLEPGFAAPCHNLHRSSACQTYGCFSNSVYIALWGLSCYAILPLCCDQY